jgi:dipeptidyl aminopeptidase/acylaminoacyl peptidase
LGPQFSPDGKWIAYWAGGVYESSLTIRDSARIYIVSAAGGAPRQLHPEFVAAAYPIWSPDGEHLLFLGNPGNTVDPGKDLDWWVTSSDGGPAIKTGVLEATRRAKLGGNSQIYPWLVIPSAWEHGRDWLVFSAQAGDSTNLWRIGISPKTWKATGRPERLTSGATQEESPSAAPGLGGSIRIAFASISQNLDIWSVPVEPNQGKVTGEPQRLTRDVGADFHPALSPDGKKMAWVAERSGSEEVWVKDLQTGEESAITFSRTKKWLPRFSPDGTKVSFGADNQIHVVPSVGGVPEVVCQACGEAMDWSSDGKSIIGETEDGRPWVVDLASRRRTDLFASRWRHFFARQSLAHLRGCYFLAHLHCAVPYTTHCGRRMDRGREGVGSVGMVAKR